jgi:hypothetical protein
MRFTEFDLRVKFMPLYFYCRGITQQSFAGKRHTLTGIGDQLFQINGFLFDFCRLFLQPGQGIY